MYSAGIQRNLYNKGEYYEQETNRFNDPGWLWIE